MTEGRPQGPSFGRSMGVFWFYTFLRFAMFVVLYAILWAVGLGGFLGALIALAVSIPASYFLLARPRQAFARTIEQRVEAHRLHRDDLDSRLSGEE